MAVVTFNITANDIDLLAKSFSYQADIPNQAGGTMTNPESAGAFLKRTVIDGLKQRIRQQKEVDAITAAAITDAIIT